MTTDHNIEMQDAAANANETPLESTDVQAELAAARAELAVVKDQALRALAEAENTRRRAAREKEDASKYAVSNFARDLLSVADNFQRALINAPLHHADNTINTFVEGVQMTEKELAAVLSRHGIVRVDPQGQPFDHHQHQAVVQIPTTEHPAGTVVQVMQAGYLLHDRLLRPAMVAVAQTPAQASGINEAAATQHIDTQA